MRVELAGQAIEGDRERMRDLYAAAAQRWVDEGHTKQVAFVPSHDRELVDAWFRLSASAARRRSLCARPARKSRSTATSRSGAARPTTSARPRGSTASGSAMQPSPSFSELPLQSLEELAAEWREDADTDKYELFVAERDGRIVGHYRALPPAARPARAARTASTSRRPRPSPRRAARESAAR